MLTERVTNHFVLNVLKSDEPDYDLAAGWGSSVLPLLERIVSGNADPSLASRATYLAGHLSDPEALRVIDAAAASSDPQVRLSAARGLGQLEQRVGVLTAPPEEFKWTLESVVA